MNKIVINKTLFFVLAFVFSVLFVVGCTAQYQQDTFVMNFCDAESTDYIDCTAISLTSDTIVMQFETTSSDVMSIESVILELPEEGVYCSTESDDIVFDGVDVYDMIIACDDLSAYEDQNTQLSFTVSMTLSDGSIVTETGSAEDWV